MLVSFRFKEIDELYTFFKMSEEKKDNLQEAEGKVDVNIENQDKSLEKTPEKEAVHNEQNESGVDKNEPAENIVNESEPDKNTPDENKQGEDGIDEIESVENVVHESKPEENTPEKKKQNEDASDESKEDGNGLDEIDESNAEDAEDEGHKDRHQIPMPDYHSMNLDKLADELDKLVKNEKVQAIKNHVDEIKHEFDQKFQELLEQKKEDFIDEGGNVIDFRYNSPAKTRFNSIYSEYKDKRNKYYKNLEQDLKLNLQNRLEIIEELKGLINVEENINDTYKHFKELQVKWRNAGPIPRVNYNDVWRTYHHHIEIFYDFLDLNKDLRDMDFKRNLEEKEKLVQEAERLANEADTNKAFRELQNLHKVWKEDIGPVAREFREDIWNRFSEATKAIHQKRQDYFKNIDKVYEKNLEVKREIIGKIKEIATRKVNSHGTWQKLIKEVETLREDFFNAGKVPLKLNEETWTSFKEVVRNFNRNKNAFYKNLKKEQHVNLEKKMELVKLADSLKDSEDWEKTTPIMKKIQSDWKTVGHVPKKYSDKIWKEFKEACNHYFNNLHAQKNKENKGEYEAFTQKKAFLDKLKAFELTGDNKKDLKEVKDYISKWKSIGRVPFNKRSIDSKFNKIVDALFKKLDVNKQDAELIKYENKLEHLANSENDSLIENEKTFIRRKIEEVKSEIRQLENNLQFINADDDNPIVLDVKKNIDGHKKSLEVWKAKLTELRNLNN